MNDRLDEILKQMERLEQELRETLHEGEQRILFRMEDGKVKFENSVVDAHRKLKTGFLRWLVRDRPQNLLTGPLIYGMAVPLLLMDILVSSYQRLCFPIYQIDQVKRKDYFVFDRANLEYLNSIEKFHCMYCEYANGLMAYMTEILGRTEQYFCPIKHAHKLLGTHSRYKSFLEYGDAADYEVRLESYRKALAEKQ